jgi:hypothetical protein
MKWLIVGLCVVLIVLLLAYARGERQRGEEVPVVSGVVLVV